MTFGHIKFEVPVGLSNGEVERTLKPVQEKGMTKRATHT